MSLIQSNDMGFAWDEWESEFRGVVGEMTDEEWGNLDDRLTRMEEQEEGIFAEINKHSEVTNDKGKIVEVTVVENKAVNKPNDNDDSVGVVEKERSGEDVMNLLKTIYDNMNKGFEMMNKHFDNMNKRFDERDKIWDKILRKPETDKLKENTEVESKQVSDK